MAAARKVDQSPVLGDDAIDEVEVAGDAAEVVENAAGHEDDCDIAPSRICDSTEHRCVRAIVARDGAVVVQRENCQLHEARSIVSWSEMHGPRQRLILRTGAMWHIGHVRTMQNEITPFRLNL